jgi:hypothetical protein
MNERFTQWIEGFYPEAALKNDAWSRMSMQSAYLSGDSEGAKRMRDEILKRIRKGLTRNPALQKLYQEIQALD